MGALNAVQLIERRVQERFIGAKTAIDVPRRPNGPWFLDIQFAGLQIVVEWRPGRGFGITSKRESGYGEGADEVYRLLAPTWRRLRALLTVADSMCQRPEAG